MNFLFEKVIADELKLCGFDKEVADAQTSLMGRVFWGFSKKHGIVKGLLIGLDHNHDEENIMQIYADKPTVVECKIIAPTKEILEDLIEKLGLKSTPEQFSNPLAYFDHITNLVKGKVERRFNEEGKQKLTGCYEQTLNGEYKPTVIHIAGLNNYGRMEHRLINDPDSSLSIGVMLGRLKQYDSLKTL